MIKLKIRDLGARSDRCPDGCLRPALGGCGECRVRISTAFECPKCKTIYNFYGAASPMMCRSCKVLLPDMYLFDMPDGGLAARTRFHFGEEE